MTKESEIVRALRHTCDGCNPAPCCEFEALGPEAADLIDRLTAENAELYGRLAPYEETGLTAQEYTESVGFVLALNKAIKKATGKTALDWEKLTAENAALTERLAAAVEMLIKFIKQSDDICDYCKNHIECAGEQCEEFEKGVGGTGNDGTEFPDWHWQCTDFDYGTCAMLANTPCNGCFENDCSGFEWRGPQEARKGE